MSSCKLNCKRKWEKLWKTRFFFDDFAFVFDGIYDCLSAEKKGEKAAEGVEISCVRDCNGECILKKCAKTNAERLVGGGSRSHEKPGPQIFLRTHPEKNCDIIE